MHTCSTRSTSQSNWKKPYKFGRANVVGWVYLLFVADNQVIVAGDRDDVRYMLRKLQDEADNWGLLKITRNRNIWLLQTPIRTN